MPAKPHSDSLVEVQNVSGIAAPAAADFDRWVRATLAALEHPPAELCIRVVDEREGASLNQSYRHKQGATNVLSFATPQGVDALGDLVLCAPLVMAEAQQQGKPVEHHWAHLCVHGVLHLCGHDHQNDADAEAMEALERKVLAALAIPDPYAQ